VADTVKRQVLTQVASAFYDPGNARWISRDPLGEPGFQRLINSAAKKQRTSIQTLRTRGLNLYGFLSDNPLNKVDPSGLDEFLDQTCQMLRDMAEDAYNDENFQLVRAINNLMESIGCFNPPPEPLPEPKVCPPLNGNPVLNKVGQAAVWATLGTGLYWLLANSWPVLIAL
jgi:RHS repeat-associated protein